MIYRLVSVAFLVLSFRAVSAGEIQVWGQTSTHSCSYYTNVSGDFLIKYRNDDLPREAKIKLISGWGGESHSTSRRVEQFSWKGLEHTPLEQTESGEWKLALTKVLASRSDPNFLRHFQFVLEVSLPSGKTFYEKGADTGHAYYQVQVDGGGLPPCLNAGDTTPKLKQLPLTVVPRP